MYFGLTPQSTRVLQDGSTRIWDKGAVNDDWDGAWTLLGFSLPDSWKRQRHDLRSRLATEGVEDVAILVARLEEADLLVSVGTGITAERRDVAGDGDHRDGVEKGRADPRHEVRRTRPGRAHAHADPTGHTRVAVRRVGATLLVTDQDVAELRVVAEHVIQRQDHTTRVAEEDIDALAEEGLAQDVGTDPGALQVARLMEHVLARLLDGSGSRRAVSRHVAATVLRRRTRRLRGIGLRRHRTLSK